MQAVKKTSPYIRKDVTTNRMMTDVLIALIPVVFFAVFRFGADALWRVVIAVVVMVGLEALAFGMMHAPDKKAESFIDKLKSRYASFTINNITIPAVSAVIFAMLVPSKLPLYAVAVGAAFGIVVGKMLFGGTGSNIFNPAAAGRIFIALALTQMFSGAYTDVDLIAGGTALSAIRTGLPFPDVLNSYALSDLFFGFIPGAMGEVSFLAILIGGIYLVVRKSADYRVMLSAVLTFVLLMTVAAFALHPDHVFTFVLYQLFSGGLLFGVVYMITDPVTSPVTRPGRIIFGMMVAAITVLIRLFGAYPEGVAFALLFSNMFVPLIDFPKWSTNKIRPAFLGGLALVLVLLSAIVFFGTGGTF
ncbi:MAG: RnfABCDGE type electron transport complex subunit D [Acholeplasmataceae bacterium]|nr:RnfABCDGE type electron transport complex subunit D [Acholeplasmataceae bacterium]